MRVKRNTGDLTFTVLNYSLLTLLAAATLYPFWWTLVLSFSAPTEVLKGSVFLWPKGFNTLAYELVLKFNLLWTSYGNTIYYVVVGTTVNVLMTFLAAYPLSRRWFSGRTLVSLLIVFTMFFGGGMIPSFLLVRNLGLLNKRLVMIIPGAISAWNLIMVRTYLSANIPDELIESAEIDGANQLQILFRLALPLSMPVLAVISLFYAVGHWNDFFSALLYLRDRELMPLQVVLRQILMASQISEMQPGLQAVERSMIQYTIKYATIIVSTVPILLLYPFLQRYFVKGIMIGALKG